ncbi:hypothetical protein NLG97_g6905 [Lecanicillium saksenae]|uniref:Uncharacterized protein n=1 Tax=Lecanicillium saksenae TaxID=468837 RepID=A0ACC1QNB4_9HYPO|nr:hypothetical protein NLG97_g6905 [Lecanicillium saksenae]
MDTPRIYAMDLSRRVLLAVEACVVVLAMLHSGHATVTAGRLQSLQCAVDGCEQQGDTMSLISSGLALAILSLVVFLARLALLQLPRFPRSIGLLYDMLMATLWILGLAHLVLARETARNLSNGSVVDTDGVVVTCWRLRGVAMASAAVVFYSGRLLLELFYLVTTPSYQPIPDEWEEKQAQEAYSPVLAFFPEFFDVSERRTGQLEQVQPEPQLQEPEVAQPQSPMMIGKKSTEVGYLYLGEGRGTCGACISAKRLNWKVAAPGLDNVWEVPASDIFLALCALAVHEPAVF